MTMRSAEEHEFVICKLCGIEIDACCELVITPITVGTIACDSTQGPQVCDSCWQLDIKFDRLVKSDPVKAHNWLQARVDELAGYSPRVQV